MLSDPAIIAFILVAIVFGVAVVMSASADWEVSHELKRATDGWAAPLVVRRYDGSHAGRARARKEAAILADHGYRLSGPEAAAAEEPQETRLATYVLIDGG